jgi:plastocyanin
MTKLYFEPITVEREGDQLQSFTWRRHVHRITSVLKRWIVRMDWWRQEVSRQYYKVECENLGTYEIYCERDGWVLERLYD